MAAQVNRHHFEQELETFGDDLLQSGMNLGHTSQDLIELSRRALQPEELADTANSEGPVETPLEKVDNVMGWTAMMLLLGGGVASAIGSYILAPVLGLFFSRIGAGFFAFVGFPLYELFTIFKSDEEGVADANVRFRLLSLSLSQGLLVGFALSDHYLSTQPLMCLTPFVVGYLFTSSLVQRQRANRRQVVLLCASAAFAANLTLGLSAGLLSLPYVFLSLLYVAFTALVLLHMMHNIHSFDERTHLHLYHVVLFTGLLLIKALTFGLFGYSSAELEVYRLQRL